MTDDQVESPELQQLRAIAELREQPFTSDVPVIGGLIVWFRTTWNDISTTWFVRPIMAQQSQFNEIMVQVLARFEEHDRELQRLTAALEQQIAYNQAALEQLQKVETDNRALQLLTDELGSRLIDQDREFTSLSHDVGESAARIVQLRNALRAIEENSSKPKSSATADDATADEPEA